MLLLHIINYHASAMEAAAKPCNLSLILRSSSSTSTFPIRWRTRRKDDGIPGKLNRMKDRHRHTYMSECDALEEVELSLSDLSLRLTESIAVEA